MPQNTILSIFTAFALFCSFGFSFAAKNTDTPAATKVALISDTHLSLSTVERRVGNPASFRTRFEEAIAKANGEKVDLVLIAGDLADVGKDEEFSLFSEVIKACDAPVLFVPGNHDVGGKHIPGKKGGITSNRYNRYKKFFGEGFWVEEKAGLRIIGLTSSLLGSSLPEEAAQWEMLETELSTPSALPTILLTHYPLFVKTADEDGGGYWNVEPEPRKRLFELIKSGGVKAVLSGHLHRPILHHHNGITYAGAPAISFGVPKDKGEPEGWAVLTIPRDGEIKVELKYFNP